MPSLRPRGQSLVLFALFLLILVMLVMATLSLSRLTHQKMELQVASDAAAYSQAVATARAYNSVALLNRAQVATMVTLAGVDSAVSYAGTYRALLNATWYGYINEWDKEYCGPSSGRFSTPRRLCEGTVDTGPTRCSNVKVQFDFWSLLTTGSLFKCSGPSCNVLKEIFGVLFITRAVDVGPSPTTDMLNKLSGAGNDNARLMMVRNEITRVKGIWQGLDDAAGLQARDIQSEAANYAGLQATALGTGLGALSPMAQASVAVTRGKLNAASVGISNREFNNGTGPGITDNSIDAAMGSRAHTFITRRADGQRALQAQIDRVLKPSNVVGEVTVNAMRGNGYFANSQNHGARPATSYAVWGDEESSVTVNYRGIDAALGLPGTASGNLRFEGYVGSTDLQNTTDQHNWCPADIEPDLSPPDVRHTMLPHAMPPAGFYDPCASSSCIWPNFIDTNAVSLIDSSDVYGQPKLMAAATTDLSTQKEPWNFLFNYKFSQSGSGATTDFRAKHAVQGVDQQMQGVAAAMAYYHRPGHWKEPPNLFNPYWRATLVRANIDSTWQGDLAKSMSPGNAATLNALLGEGFAGIP